MTEPKILELPKTLKDISWMAIDYVNGRSELNKNQINKLYKWIQGDGWGVFIDKSVQDDFAIDMASLSYMFNDEYLVDYEGIDLENITNIDRAALIKQKIETIWDEDEWVMKSIIAVKISNAVNEQACIGALLESQGQNGMVPLWFDVFKTYQDILNKVKATNSLLLLDDAKKLSDSELLTYWKYE